MKCFECALAGKAADAIGVCHHCSLGLCPQHAVLTSDPIVSQQPVAKSVELPKKARALLCRTCLDALRQHQAIEVQSPERRGEPSTGG